MKQLLGLGALAVLLVGTVPAAARPGQVPVVDVQSAAGVAPDGRSMTVQVLASCPERWTVVETRVTVSQGGASGQASFPLTCVGFLQPLTVEVPSSSGTFALGRADVTATLVARRGKVESASDSESVFVQPSVLTNVSTTARLEAGGAAVTIGVTVACPVGAEGGESYVNVSQGETRGSGPFVPVCDGSPHTFTVRVDAALGTYTSGVAQALVFAAVVHDGIAFFGIDDKQVTISG
jgi:hypothetical protein